MKYGYYEETTVKSTNYTGQRLRLDGVGINGQNYTLEYASGKLPSVHSYSKDYWGYYNGAENTALCASPKYVLKNNEVVYAKDILGNANRFASAELCKVGMLNKITYPTGGYTIFEFEPNRFNDEFFYPDASYKQVTTTHTDLDVSMYGTMTQTKTFTASQANYDMKIVANINGTSDAYTVTVKNASGSVVKTLNYQGKKQLSENISLSLTKGTSYTVEMKLTAAEANRYSTVAQCALSHNTVNTTIPTKNENGGYSIGGGLRIKSIKNYDAPRNGTTGEFLSGTLYEYAGGKLLIPTVRIAEHYINYTGMEITRYDESTGYSSSETRPINVAFQNISADPAYLDICSLGVPATVGYDTVTTKELDKDGKKVKRKKVSKYHNYKYEINNGMNSRMSGNVYFYNSMGYLNGKIKNEYIYTETDKLACSTSYDYNNNRLGSILFPKSVPSFFGIDGIGVSNGSFDVSMYRHYNIWCYLTKKTETLYDSNGKVLGPITTSFVYNEVNHLPNEKTVSNKEDVITTQYTYPSAKKVTGYQLLNNAHNISELMAVETYRNGTFTGGSKYFYKTDENPVTKLKFPVAYRCYSVLPNASKSSVLEMEVTSFDGYGNIREYKKKNGTPVTIIWSYNHQLPIMEIVGCTYEEACKKATSLSSLEGKPSVAETTMSSIHATLRKNLPDALVTAYTYSPWQSVSQIIKPNGEKTVYSYDSYGRLTTVLDANQSTFQPIQMYNYNYKNK